MNVFDIYATLSLETQNYDNGIAAAKSAAENFGSAVSTVVDAGSRAYAGLVKDSVDAYGEFEQMVGGMRQLFGEDIYKDVVRNAEGAYKTTQMSANQYLNTATTFSGSLIRNLEGDTEQAIGLIDMAMQDAADNVNVFGGDLNFVLRAYQGFGRQTFLMLDNLRLGYAGTKTEARQMLVDARKLTEVYENLSEIELANLPPEQVELYKELSKIDLSKVPYDFGDKDFSMLTMDSVIKAIHVMQQYRGITGITLIEGANTIQGTMRQTKAAWENLKIAFAGGMDLNEAVNNLIDSIFGDRKSTGLLNQIIPRVATTIQGISDFLVKATPILAEAIPEMIETLRPSIEAAVDSIGTLITKILPSVIDFLWPVVRDIISTLADTITAKMHEEGGIFGIIADVFDFIRDHSDSLPGLITAAWGAITALNIGSDVLNFLTLLSSVVNKATLLIGLIGAIAAVAFLYRGEISLWFSSIGTMVNNVFENAQLVFENLRMWIENMDWKALFQMIISDIGVGLANMINNAIEAIETALNNFISGVDISLFGMKLFEGSKHTLTLPRVTIDQEANTDLHDKVLYGKDPEVRKKIEANWEARDANNEEDIAAWNAIIAGTGDDRSMSQRAMDTLGEVFGWLGFKTNLFSKPTPKPVPDEVPESFDKTTEAVEATNSALETGLALLGGGDSGSLADSAKEMGEAGEGVGENGLVGLIEKAADLLGSDLVSNLETGTAALSEGDGSLLNAISQIDEKTNSAKGSLKSIGDYLKGEWLQALQQASNVESLTSALDQIVSKLQEINTAAGNALTAIENLVNYAKEHLYEINLGGGGATNDGSSPHRAFGGSVLKGETYWVGEKGPEPFIAGQSGTIIPTNKLGGTTTQQFNFNFYGEVYGDEDSFRSMVTKVAKGVIRQEVRAGV